MSSRKTEKNNSFRFSRFDPIAEFDAQANLTKQGYDYGLSSFNGEELTAFPIPPLRSGLGQLTKIPPLRLKLPKLTEIPPLPPLETASVKPIPSLESKAALTDLKVQQTPDMMSETPTWPNNHPQWQPVMHRARKISSECACDFCDRAFHRMSTASVSSLGSESFDTRDSFCGSFESLQALHTLDHATDKSIGANTPSVVAIKDVEEEDQHGTGEGLSFPTCQYCGIPLWTDIDRVTHILRCHAHCTEDCAIAYSRSCQHVLS